MTIIHKEDTFTKEQHDIIDKMLILAKLEFPDVEDALLLYQIKGWVLNPEMYKDHYDNKTVIEPKKRDSQEEYNEYCKYDDETLKEHIKRTDAELNAN